jgi:hypothetical protein
MQNRLRLTQLVHAQHFVEVQIATQRSTNSKDWNGIVGENTEFSYQTQSLRRKPKQPADRSMA